MRLPSRVSLALTAVAGLLLAVAVGCEDEQGYDRDALAAHCQAVADAMADFNDGAGRVPDHLLVRDGALDGSEFDVGIYWDAFAHIGLADGWVMDYVYDYTELGGNPRLYVRPMDAERPLAWSELEDLSYDEKRWPELGPWAYLFLDGTPESYVEALVFTRLAGDFYQYWHSSSFHRVVCTASALEALEDELPTYCRPFSEEERAALAAVDPRPSVRFDEDSVYVRFASFSDCCGLTVFNYEFDRARPTQNLRFDPDDIIEVPYNCGVQF